MWKAQFEVFLFSGVIIFIIHSLKYQGWRETVKIFGIGAIYAGWCESFGVGAGYFSEPGYLIYLPFVPAPLCTMLGWTTSYYISIFLANGIFRKFPRYQHNILLKSVIVGLIATFHDFQLDPVAVKSGWWIWSETYRDFFFEVPLLNFIAWFFAISTFAYAYLWTGERNWPERKKLMTLVLSVPFLLLISGSLTLGVTFITNKLGF